MIGRGGRSAIVVAMVGASLVVAGALGGAGRTGLVADGGIFLIAGVPSSIDPAISIDAYPELRATCALLMNYPVGSVRDRTRAVPEVAAGYPTVSGDGKTFTFTIRDGFRFSTGEKVTAGSFAHEINRLLNPAMKSPWVQYVQDVVGARAVIEGKATQATGVEVRGNKLIIRLTDSARDLPSRVSTYPFCAVPTDLPINPEGVGAPLPSAGPYYVSEFVAGQKLVLKQNPFYRGSRPRHVDEFDASSGGDPVGEVESGAADFADVGSASDLAGVEPKYRSQLYSVPGIGIRVVVLNSSQPLFKDNAPLRRAVNFAINRSALLGELGGAITGRPTDQYLPPSMPGFVDAKIYPLTHPDAKTARALARGHTRSGEGVLYIKDKPTDIAEAQIIQRDLEPIGIRVKVEKYPGPALFQKLFTPGTPYDMALLGFGPDYFDPYDMLNVLFDGRLIGTPVSFNLAHFDSPTYNALLDAASRLTGSARYRAYGKLDVNLARNAAPVAAYEYESALTFVSKRVGCVILNPFLDLASVCLK